MSAMRDEDDESGGERVSWGTDEAAVEADEDDEEDEDDEVDEERGREVGLEAERAVERVVAARAAGDELVGEDDEAVAESVETGLRTWTGSLSRVLSLSTRSGRRDRASAFSPSLPGR